MGWSDLFGLGVIGKTDFDLGGLGLYFGLLGSVGLNIACLHEFRTFLCVGIMNVVVAVVVVVVVVIQMCGLA